MILLWMAQAALAGQIYINGQVVNPAQISGTTLEKVDISFDAAGNVRVSAPGYKIEVMSPPGGAVAPMVPNYPPPMATATAPPPPVPAALGGAPGLHPSGVAKAAYWLVTEDSASVGHTVEVFVNDQLVHTARSGEPVRILDVGAFLRRGPNKVVMRSQSYNAGGGTMYVYVGTGSDQSGTVVMDTPQVQFGLGPSRNGPYEREYAINVP